MTNLIYILLIIASLGILSCSNPNTPLSENTNNYDTISLIIESESAQDSINYKRLQSLGGVELLDIDRESKCNLTTSKYLLNNVILDSADLGFIVEYLSKKINIETSMDSACPYPKMTLVYLFANMEDYKLKDNIASSSIVPSYGIDIYVSSRKLSELRKNQTKQ